MQGGGRLEGQVDQHEAFWRGEGPCLLLVPPRREDLYDLRDYPRRYRDPEAMWASEMARARRVLEWPTDGIATVRPNLGVTFIPAMAGAGCQVQDGAMPWPGGALGRDAIRVAQEVEIEATETYGLAAAFYAVHRERAPGDVYAYLPDTQGVFDIAHLLYGEAIFYELTEKSQRGWIEELLGIASRLYERTSLVLKRAIGEENDTQVHGHGTEQGVYFPHAGVRMSEDTATLLSGAMIERTILPAIREACRPFGGVFVHFCGFHRVFFHQLAAMPEVKAIDLGNPEKYETAWLFEQCARTGTVLYSRVTAEGGESWRRYIERLSGLVRSTGARVILRPGVFPEDRDQCQAMLDLWHERTC